MVTDALVQANDYLNIASHIQDPSQYWKVREALFIGSYLAIMLIYKELAHISLLWLQLDDSILKTIETAPDQELRESRNLILRIRRRDLYQVYRRY